MEIIIWPLIFIASLALLVKSADWVLASAEKIGIAIGLSPFIVGVIIVGTGTSLPELVSSLAAVFAGVTEVVAANAIGSNIANILLIVGIAAVFARRLTITKNLIDLDIPLLAISTILLAGVAWDAVISRLESIILLAAFGIYLAYTLVYKDDDETAFAKNSPENRTKNAPLNARDLLLLLVGIIGLALGAKFLIDSVVALSGLLAITTGVIALVAVAVGTSLPEFLVSVKAAIRGNSELALGNIFGSNIFNAFVVVGLPGLFSTLAIDAQTFTVGLPALLAATFLFIISGISRRIHIWEGAMYLVVYAFFVLKLFGV